MIRTGPVWQEDALGPRIFFIIRHGRGSYRCPFPCRIVPCPLVAGAKTASLRTEREEAVADTVENFFAQPFAPHACEEDFQRLDRVLDAYYPQMERDLLGLLSLPSVKGQPQPGAPFGPAVAEALDYSLAAAQSLGFMTENLDGYVGLADLPGCEQEEVGVLCHVDVVPATGDWQHPPFAPQVVDGRIYGRGACDDKGPLIACLYGALALQDCCFPLRKTVRLIIGGDEEHGSADLAYFLARRQPPRWGFSPDADFPVVTGELGLAHYAFAAAWPQEPSAPLCLLAAAAGSADNVVPAEATALFAPGAEVGERLRALIAAQPLPQAFCLQEEEDGWRLLVHGRAAHASQPELGQNAAALLLAGLASLPLAPAGARDFVLKLAQISADPYAGGGLPPRAGDQRRSTVLTRLALTATGGEAGFDMRFPLADSGEQYRSRLAELAREQGWQLCRFAAVEPHQVDADSELVQRLLAAYREVTGDLHPPKVIGGATYARALANFVAFGPDLPGEESLAHQADEHLDCAHLLRLAKIYARAIYALAR